MFAAQMGMLFCSRGHARVYPSELVHDSFPAHSAPVAQMCMLFCSRARARVYPSELIHDNVPPHLAPVAQMDRAPAF